MKNVKILLSVAVVTFLSTACGNLVQPSTGAVSNASTSSNGIATAQQCSASPNVSSVNSGGLQSQYSACANGTTVGSFELFKSDSAITNICIFPAQVSSGVISMYISNPYAAIESRYVSQCTSTQNPGIVVNFSGLAFNAVYVVDAANAGNMAQCIASGNISSCAYQLGFDFSYGQFKN